MSQVLRYSGTQVLAFAVLILAAPSAFAQHIDVTASLDVTDGLARVGYYVPVTLKATNGSDRAATEVFVSTGGPVDVRASWILSAGETDETILPVFYVGGDLALEVVFRDRTGGEVARVRLEPLEVRPVPDETVLVWHTPMAGEPDDVALDMIRREWEGRPLRILCKSYDSIYAATQCQLVDESPVDLPFRRWSRVDVTPHGYGLMAAEDQTAADPGRLWVWLALFAAGVPAVVLLVPRRRATWAAAAMGALGVATAAGIWLTAGGSSARLHEARFVYRGREVRPSAEQFVWLEGQGGAAVRFRFGVSRKQVWPVASVWPRPVFRSADDMYRPAGVLVLEESPALVEETADSFAVRTEVRHGFESTRPVCLLHRPTTDVPEPWPDWTPPTAEGLATLARRADAVAALLVRGSEATDAGGRTQPLDAWAVGWKRREKRALAWCGRSLAWWDAHRRTGHGPQVVAWFRDPAPEPPEGMDAYERLPAMVVYGE